MKAHMNSLSKTARRARPLRFKLLPLVASGVLCLSANLGAEAAKKTVAEPTAAAGAVLTAAAATAAAVIDVGAVSPEAAADSNYRLTFKQLGRVLPFELHGTDGRFTLPFSVRADEVITRASLKLRYTYSPDLLSELSKINVLINGEVAASLALPKETAGSPVTQVVNLPPQLITEYNKLTLQLVGHYTTACEDPLHSSLWATISSQSVLELSTDSAPYTSDLAMLPEPFFDPRDGRNLSLPVIFSGKPDNNTLEAAGTLASWFGMNAIGRVLKFPTAFNVIPAKGNAIVLLSGASSIAGLTVAEPSGPALAVVVNPNDPNGKLLLVQGRNGQDLKLVAAAVATASKTLSGQSMAITKIAATPPRRAYDAPRWLRSDRPVKFGELIDAAALNVSGYNPGNIAINLRLPPDLFSSRDKGVPLDLKYRYTPQQNSTNSSLTISVNDNFLKSTLLLPMERLNGAPLLAKLQADETLAMQAQARIPLYDLRSKSVLQLRYMYDYIKEGECHDVIIDNVRGAIEPGSTLDISAFSHHIGMPNLAVFGSSGYPFTRFADLSQTAVVLPDALHEPELSTYLNLLGRFGESTGYPSTAITVARGAELAEVSDKDLLVIASSTNQPLLKAWVDAMPDALDTSRSPGPMGQFSRLLAWVSSALPDLIKPAAAATPTFSTSGMSAYAAGFESPLRSSRSVVVLWASEPSALPAEVDRMLGEDGAIPKIGGGLTLVHGHEVESMASVAKYHISDLDSFTRARMFMSDNLALFVLLSAFAAALLAKVILTVLRAQSNKRMGL